MSEQARMIGEMLRELREARGVTQQFVADGTGLGRTSISQIESGRTTVTIENLFAISMALGYTVDVLFSRVENWKGPRADEPPQMRMMRLTHNT